jgi:hypothetical protein
MPGHRTRDPGPGTREPFLQVRYLCHKRGPGPSFGMTKQVLRWLFSITDSGVIAGVEHDAGQGALAALGGGDEDQGRFSHIGEGRAVNHAGQTMLYLTAIHASRGLLMALIANIRAAFGHVMDSAR